MKQRKRWITLGTLAMLTIAGCSSSTVDHATADVEGEEVASAAAALDDAFALVNEFEAALPDDADSLEDADSAGDAESPDAGEPTDRSPSEDESNALSPQRAAKVTLRPLDDPEGLAAARARIPVIYSELEAASRAISEATLSLHAAQDRLIAAAVGTPRALEASQSYRYQLVLDGEFGGFIVKVSLVSLTLNPVGREVEQNEALPDVAVPEGIADTYRAVQTTARTDVRAARARLLALDAELAAFEGQKAFHVVAKFTFVRGANASPYLDATVWTVPGATRHPNVCGFHSQLVVGTGSTFECVESRAFDYSITFENPVYTQIPLAAGDQTFDLDKTVTLRKP